MDEIGSLQYTGRARRLGSKVSPTWLERIGLPTNNRFCTVMS